jgi:hypothetical protein
MGHPRGVMLASHERSLVAARGHREPACRVSLLSAPAAFPEEFIFKCVHDVFL